MLLFLYIRGNKSLFSYDMKKKIDKPIPAFYNYSCFGRLAQLGEHPLDVRKVTGPSPVAPTISKRSYLPEAILGDFSFIIWSSTQAVEENGLENRQRAYNSAGVQISPAPPVASYPNSMSSLIYRFGLISFRLCDPFLRNNKVTRKRVAFVFALERRD